MDKFIGKRLDGRYEISELIGVGGMAVVYKAYDNIDDRVVAIKILKEEFLANDEFRRRFKNESKAIAVLNHPNIVKVYDVSFGDVLQYIVMEYINGITLKKYIEQQGIIDWKEAIHFTSQILKALQHAHEKGIVHRDIKPQNIMLLADGTIKVTDFGIARFSRSEQRTITDKAIGSVHYISPEQARGDFTDGRADIYSVGVILYEMTTGRVPFQADSAVSVAIMQLQNEPVHPTAINSMIPKGLEEITLKAMKKDAVNRFDTAGEMLSDLMTVYNDPSVQFDYQFKTVVEKNDDKPSKKSAKKSDDDDSKSNLIPILSGIAIVFVVAIIIAAIFIFRAFSGGSGETFACPDFVGKNYEEIIKSSEFSKYNIVKSDESTYNSEYKAGFIYKQSPDKGTKIKEKSEITVYVSLGGKKIKLSDYSNFNLDTVKEELETEGLKFKIVEMPDNKIKEGYVISTNPVAGSVVSTGDEITLYVSSGEETVEIEVPNVVQQTLDDAKKAIESRGFKVGDISYSHDDTVPSGCVISQTPAGKGKANKGSGISLVVSKGQATTQSTTIREITDVSFTIDKWPNLNKVVSMTVFMDGEQVLDQTANIDLGSIGSKSVTVLGTSGVHSVIIKLDNKNYMKYEVDFDKKSWSLKETYKFYEE